MKKYTTLFEQQSYKDALEYYMSVLKSESADGVGDNGQTGRFTIWDYVIITASNEAQAKAYELQLEHRLKNGQIPSGTHYAVIPDLNGQRVGSGGATFSCIKYVAECEASKSVHVSKQENLDEVSANAGVEPSNSEGSDNLFSGKRILVIHSGGDSKRVPQYSACGKLFSPVPRVLPGGRRSTLFDEFMIGMSTVAGRISDGMLICSGDVLLLFNALQIDFVGSGAAALSIKEKVETGKNHGVFLADGNGGVAKFLHKQTVDTLRELGAVDGRGNVDIDTGAVIFSSNILNELYNLIDTQESYLAFVNERARISFYADFLYPLAADATLEQFYNEKPEGDFTDELRECRTALWKVLSPYSMKLVRFSPASFIHFGTTKELLHLMTDGMEEYRFLDWKGNINSNVTDVEYAVSGSYISPESFVGKGCYIEDSRVYPGSVVEDGCILSGVTLSGVTVPAGTVLHGLKLSDGRFVCRMYGVNDNPKDGDMWTRPVYPIRNTMDEAVKATLSGDKSGECTSLRDSFNSADVTAILPWQENLYAQVIAESILQMINEGIPACTVKAEYTDIFGTQSGNESIRAHVIKYLCDKAESLKRSELSDFKFLIRIYGYLYTLTGQGEFSDKCFATIREATLESAMNSVSYRNDYRLLRDVTVNLPVRVNWGGGWSDTPPYCMENGGTVLNAAISLNGSLPIEVTVKKLDEHVIELASTDIGVSDRFTDISLLRECRNPSDAFALHKAALIACGVVPAEDCGVSVADICEKLGGGIYLNTRVIDIPKGSGLGTSSILAGACVKALFRALGVNANDSEVFERVLVMEQLMSTGGGWQDQVGGIVPGIKMVTTSYGLNQKITCSQLRISDETYSELNERFAIIYTGQRRLARNLLRDVVGRYITGEPDSVEAHVNIQRLAVLMRFELEKGNVDGFAELLSEHWEESKRIDAGSTNTCIDQIFSTIDDLICGKMICGAGGGGFLQVVLKRGVSPEMLRERLSEVFQDSGVDVWNCSFV